MHKRLLISSSLVLPALIFGLTLEQKFSKRAATVLAAERDTTTPTLLTTDACHFDGVKITALNRTRNLVDDKVEVGWDFTMPQQLAPLGTCAMVDHFTVLVTVSYEGGGSKEKSEHASGLSRNAVFRFSDIARKVKRIDVIVAAEYKITAESLTDLGKDF